MLKKLLAAAAAVSLMGGPLMAQSATPLAVEPAVEGAGEGSRLTGGGDGAWIAQATFAAIVVFGVLLALEVWPFDEEDAESP